MMGINGHLYKVLPISKNFGAKFIQWRISIFYCVLNSLEIGTLYKVYGLGYTWHVEEVSHLWNMDGSIFIALGQLLHTFLHYILGEIISLESKLHENKDPFLFCSQLYPRLLEQYLTHQRCSKNIISMKKCPSRKSILDPCSLQSLQQIPYSSLQ